MGGSEQGPDDGFAVQYRTVHALEVVIPHTPGGGITGRDMAAAQQQLVAAVEQYGRRPRVDEFDLTTLSRGVAVLSCVIAVERGATWAHGGPTLEADLTPGQRMERAGGPAGDGMHLGGGPVVAPQADGMDMGPGFGRAGAG